MALHTHTHQFPSNKPTRAQKYYPRAMFGSPPATPCRAHASIWARSSPYGPLGAMGYQQEGWGAPSGYFQWTEWALQSLRPREKPLVRR